MQSNTNGGKTIWFSIKPIKKGEELFVSYAPLEMNSTEERQKYLLSFNLKCKCSRCQGRTASPAQRQQLFSDPAFQYIMANVRSILPLTFNTEQVNPLMDALMHVLRQCGQMDWCDEMGYAIKYFQTLYNFRSSGGGTDFNHPLVRAILMHCK